MGRVGSSPRDKRRASSGSFDYSKVINLSLPGSYIVRLIAGPFKRETIFVPTVGTEEGETVESFVSFIRDPDGCILDMVAAGDERIRRKYGEKEPRSALRGNVKYVWVGFYIKGPVEGASTKELRLINIPYKANKRIQELDKAVDDEDSSLLANGRIFCYNLKISRILDPKRKGPEYMRTEYSVDPVPKSVAKSAGKIPISALELDPDVDEDYEALMSLFQEYLPEEGFTITQAWDSGDLEDYDSLDVDAYCKVSTDEDIVKRLQENPINLLAFRDAGKPTFPVEHLLEFRDAVNATGIESIERAISEGADQYLLPAPEDVGEEIKADVTVEPEEEPSLPDDLPEKTPKDAEEEDSPPPEEEPTGEENSSGGFELDDAEGGTPEPKPDPKEEEKKEPPKTKKGKAAAPKVKEETPPPEPKATEGSGDDDDDFDLWE